MKKIKVWLDDLCDNPSHPERRTPTGFIGVKTAWDAIKLLKNGNVEEISLDHDLGDDEVHGTGYTVSKFIEEEAFKSQNGEKSIPPLVIKVHSANPVGIKKMEMSIKNAYRFWGSKMKFTEWLGIREQKEKSSRTKKGKKVPGKYLKGLKNKGKYGSKQAMKKEIDKFAGTSNYKKDWDADYDNNGRRIKTKKGKATKAYERLFGENADKALENKSKKSGVSKAILRRVYNRGKAAWNSGHRPGVAQEQWAMGRVNSFITGVGGARKADSDLWKKAKRKSKKKHN